MVQLVNRSKDSVLADNIEPALTFITRLKGLMGRSQITPGYSLWLRPCSAVHTFFMRFPVDVIFVSKDWRVVGTKKNMHPWRATGFYSDVVHVFEFAAGTLNNTGTEVGDRLLLKGG